MRTSGHWLRDCPPGAYGMRQTDRQWVRARRGLLQLRVPRASDISLLLAQVLVPLRLTPASVRAHTPVPRTHLEPSSHTPLRSENGGKDPGVVLCLAWRGMQQASEDPGTGHPEHKGRGCPASLSHGPATEFRDPYVRKVQWQMSRQPRVEGTCLTQIQQKDTRS